jgi:hypothetical protein
MSQIPVWFERKFDFTFPAEQYPSVCIRLRGAPARIEEILRGVSRDVLVNRPADKWSAQEQPMRLVDHLHFAAEHDDHHLARSWELINAFT